MAGIIPIILCGGEGRRLWPLSTPERPKPFLRIGSERSLFEEALLRCRGPAFDESPVIVTGVKHYKLAKSAVDSLGIKAEFVLEPDGRDSGPAVIAGVLKARERSTDGLVLILAADHWIEPVSVFQQDVERSMATARRGLVVTFGITPHSPNPSYGYLLPGDPFGEAPADSGIRRLEGFFEKPAIGRAARLIAQGALWNSGNFLAQADVLHDLASEWAPDMMGSVRNALAMGSAMDGACTLGADAFAEAPKISFDKAIMERCGQGAVCQATHHWRDLGTWRAIDEILPKDSDGNHPGAHGRLRECRNTSIISDGTQVTVAGCDGVMVIAAERGVVVHAKTSPQPWGEDVVPSAP